MHDLQVVLRVFLVIVAPFSAYTLTELACRIVPDEKFGKLTCVLAYVMFLLVTAFLVVPVLLTLE